MTANVRARPEPLVDADYEVVVVGGGIAGAGVARDLSLRGVSVALVDKGDFGSATTSRSSKLIHGGLRYLELFDFALVRESLRERATLERLAPHLVRPLPFLVPIYKGSSRGLITVRLGLKVYDWLTPGRDRERYRVLRPLDALALEPTLRAEHLKGAGYYFDDLLVLPERLCLENVLSAARHGAAVFNYAEMEEVVRDPSGRYTGVRVRDLLTGDVVTLGARIIVNAAGPWVDEIRAQASVQDRGPRILRRTKGIHCLLPRLTDRAIYHSTSDDRMIFVIPWREFSLVGTTDSDFDGDVDRLHATHSEVVYLLDEVRRVLPDPRVSVEHVAYTYAGVRPLSHEEGKRESDVSRAHRVVVEGGGRFVSITGTKLTCFRSLAEELGERVGAALGRSRPSRTARLALDGAENEVDGRPPEAWARVDVSEDLRKTGLSKETLETLVSTYGRGYRKVLDLLDEVSEALEPLCPSNPDITAQLHLAIREERAVSIQDVLLRRTGIGTSACQGFDCAEGIGRRMAKILGWSSRRLSAELEAFEAHVARSQRFKTA